jgi:ATP-dependent RNA/DNA helicase IGHMBP2
VIDPDNHFNTFMDLLEMEREAEKEDNKRKLDRWPVEMREQLGKTVARLSIERRDVGVGGLPLLVLSRHGPGEALSPFHAMDQGDLVRVTFLNGEFSVEGHPLYHVEDYRVTVALNEDLVEEPVREMPHRFLGSDATYKRMRRALDIALRQGGRLGELREILLGNNRPAFAGSPKLFFNDRLNDFQRDAVRSALAAQDIALIHGPPGTGKTTVLAEIIRQAVAQGKSVLATAPSNIAVDNMLEKLLDAGLNVVRLGHPARILENLRHATLFAQLDEHPDQKVIRLMDQTGNALVVQRYRGQGKLTIEEDKALKRKLKPCGKKPARSKNPFRNGSFKKPMWFCHPRGDRGSC